MNVAAAYNHFINWIANATGASDGLLHLHAGMAVFLAARLITGRTLASTIPFLVVCCAELLNEFMDRIHNGAWLWNDTAFDVVNTLIWPFILTTYARINRSRGSRDANRPQAGESGDTALTRKCGGDDL